MSDCDLDFDRPCPECGMPAPSSFIYAEDFDPIDPPNQTGET